MKGFKGRMNNKLKTPGQLLKIISKARKEKKVIVWTNGCFDILHIGHLSFLRAAKKLGHILIVGLNSDSSVRRNKGPLRPVIPQEERALILSEFVSVDYITIFNGKTPEKVIKKLQPDYLVKGQDWAGKTIAGKDFLQKDGKVILLPIIKNHSTTSIIKKIQEL